MDKIMILPSYASIDISMMLGESAARQITTWKKYFHEKFGEAPSAVLNRFSFLHSRGLVQLLADAGFNRYLFIMSDSPHLSFPGDSFEWVGFDGSSVKARKISKPPETDKGTDEEFFPISEGRSPDLPQFRGDMNPGSIRPSTTMNRLERQLCRLEHKFYTAEKLLSLGIFSGGKGSHPDKIYKVAEEIIFSKPGDVLPLNRARAFEEEAITELGHASAIIDREVDSFFFNTCRNPEFDSHGRKMIKIINPHPFDVNTITGIDLNKNEQDYFDSGSGIPVISDEMGTPVAMQFEKQKNVIKEGIGNKLIFRASVPAGSTRKYSCFWKDIPATAGIPEPETNFVFKTDKSKLVIDRKTGFPSSCEFSGNQLLGNESMNFSIVDENTEPVFSLLTDPVSISEDGPVRTILESIFECSNSSIHVRYILPKPGPYFDVEITVNPMEKEKILIWSIPVGYNMNCIGRTLRYKLQ
jgi:hypothetical protein